MADQMKLFYSPLSPYVRKVLVSAHELGLFDQIELVRMKATPIEPDLEIRKFNPLGKIPTLIMDGDVIFDSRVICELLDAKAGGGRLLPLSGADRWKLLTLQAVADGMMDAALLARYESHQRPESFRWREWLEGQLLKIRQSLSHLEANMPAFAGKTNIAAISAACALGYIDLRFADLGWRARHRALSVWFDDFCARPSMRETRPEDSR